MKKSVKKLSLGKMTITNLSAASMNAVVGGATASVGCNVPVHTLTARIATAGCGIPPKPDLRKYTM